DAARPALRTQRVIAYETGVPGVVDPLGGSYFVETLTDRIEQLAEEIFAAIERMGDGSMLAGVLRGVETGWFTNEIAQAAFEEQRRYEDGDLIQVGVNAFVERDEPGLEILEIGQATEDAQIAAIARTRLDRTGGTVAAALQDLASAAADPQADLMQPLIACARARCT